MVVLVLAGAVAGAQVIGQTMQNSNRLMNELYPATALVYQLHGALLNQETGVRGYALGADPQFLDPYEIGRRDEQRAATRLRELIGDRPDLLADLEQVERTAAEWRDKYAGPVTTTTTPAAARAVAAGSAVSGKEIFDRLRGEFDHQNGRIAETVQTNRASLAHARTVRNAVLIGMVATFLAVAVILTVVVRRLVARPLATLTAASQRVAGGEFDHRIRVRGPSDITAVATAVEAMRRRIVAELQASRTQQTFLEQQSVELRQQAAELSRSNAELEQFAYVASHDLQEPLRKVASFCQLIAKRYGDKLDERGLQYIDFAVDGAKRMQVLINDLLTFSRVGRVDDTKVEVDVDDTLDQALTNLARSIEKSGADIERPSALPRVIGNPTLLTMLWQNLVGNAVKFARPDQPVRIEIRHTELPDGGHRISVADNGIGIAPEFAEKVFVIFQRLHSRDEYPGTGIGLAICRKIVEFHGGAIALDPEYTEGARFTFTLPPAGQESAEVHGVTAAERSGAEAPGGLPQADDGVPPTDGRTP
ncbi:sensor histidine kinase [Nocardia bovistercoris]|uniref:histidine kinase n=1 Tax=Nocardia bovistercoris TaxID=2785916 RepID=A0A931I6V6_9NOCA|nr:sensor histidine kinase [Nocardia bovistercoris]MBH0775316.1 CHASE3 domain-containing protein [Nocardia bovistercoris]